MTKVKGQPLIARGFEAGGITALVQMGRPEVAQAIIEGWMKQDPKDYEEVKYENDSSI